MTKLFSALKGAFAIAMAFSFFGVANAFPTLQDICGREGFSSGKNYKFSGTVTNIAEGLPFKVEGSFIFSIFNNYGSPNISNFIVPAQTSNNVFKGNYNIATGELKFSTKYVAWNAGASNATYYALSQTDDTPWDWQGSVDPVVWQFNDDGSITIPDFELVNFNSIKDTPTVIAKFTGCSAVPYSGSVGGGGGTGGGDYGPEQESPLTGNWQFTFSDPYNGLNDFSALYQAHVRNNVVTFTEVAEYGTGEYTIKANVDGNTLTFTQVALNRAIYSFYQGTFTNGNTATLITDLNNDSFSATFNEDKQELTFINGVGLKYGNDYDGEIDWSVAFNLVSAKRMGDFPPELTINGGGMELGEDFLVLNFSLTASHFELSEVASWKVVVNEVIAQEDDDDLVLPLEGCTISVTGNRAVITIPNISQGTHVYQIMISAYNEDGDLICTSNRRDITPIIGPHISIRVPEVSIIGNSATYSAKLSNLQGFENNTTYKMKFSTSTDPEAENYSEFYNSVSFENGSVYSTLSNLQPGKYNYYIEVVAYNEAGELICTSNRLSPPLVEIFAQSISISNPTYEIDADDVLTVYFDYELNGFDESEAATYEAVFSYNEPGSYNTHNIEVEPVMENGTGTAVIYDLERNYYAFTIVVTAYDADGKSIAESNPLRLSLILSGVEEMMSDGKARYFNINGIEVANPGKGIVIKVENGKASKVVR